MLDTLLLATDSASMFRIFGFGFLAGSLFAILIMLIFDWVKEKEHSQTSSN